MTRLEVRNDGKLSPFKHLFACKNKRIESTREQYVQSVRSKTRYIIRLGQVRRSRRNRKMKPTPFSFPFALPLKRRTLKMYRWNVEIYRVELSNFNVVRVRSARPFHARSRITSQSIYFEIFFRSAIAAYYRVRVKRCPCRIDIADSRRGNIYFFLDFRLRAPYRRRPSSCESGLYRTLANLPCAIIWAHISMSSNSDFRSSVEKYSGFYPRTQ